MADAAAFQSDAVVGAVTQLTNEIDGLRTDMQALVQGLTLMVETQAAQSEMLEELLEAAAQEDPAENPMEELVRQMTAALDRLTEVQRGTEREVGRLGQRMAAAIIRGAGAPGSAGTDGG